MPFYAHTVPGRSEAEWEELSVHLAEVEAAAAKKGARFGAQALAGLAGRLHDLGKYAPDFQARLRGSSKSVDHSTAGAVWAERNLAPQWGRLLAHVVAGHHAGLQDDLLSIDGRIETKGALLDVAERGAWQDGFVLPENNVAGPLGMRCGGTERGFWLAFLTRMVFSCLIDADRLAAAGLLAQPVEHPSIAALEARLLASMPRREANPSNINMWRDAVRTAALARAADPPGVFTLTVPTGGGKTLTSLAFALAHARKNRLDRVVVVIPFTSIIEQTAEVYRNALGDLGAAVLEHHSAFDMEDEAKWARARVGPERLRLHMERWDHPIVVTTAVQFFESLFSNRPSRCRKLHSLARSVIVLDEAQTMPLHLLRPCVLALKELARNYGSNAEIQGRRLPFMPAQPVQIGFVQGAAGNVLHAIDGGGHGFAKEGWPAVGPPGTGPRSNSTACRKLTPCFLITQSIGPPPALQPKQCQRFFAGVTFSDGSRSSWNGHSSARSAPCRASTTPLAATRSATNTDAFRRSSSASPIRAMQAASTQTKASPKPVKQKMSWKLDCLYAILA
jgi:CRISPR-associated endonuclease Cas3-HD